MRLTHPLLIKLRQSKRDFAIARPLSDLYAAQWVLDQEATLRPAAEAEANADVLCRLLLALLQALNAGQISVCLNALRLDVPSEELLERLRAFETIYVVDEGAATGLVSDIARCCIVVAHGQVFLARWWSYRQRLWQHFSDRVREHEREREKIEVSPLDADAQHIAAEVCGLELSDGVLTPDAMQQLDDQQRAVCAALAQNLTLVSGGPGTGKTTTAARILQALVQQFAKANGGEHPRIALLAPTGKAAARLEDAIAQSAAHRHDALLQTLVQGASMTVHRFLARWSGLSAHSTRMDLLESRIWSAEQGKKADVDIVLVDESSMLDLVLTLQLFECLPAQCKLILLGDPYQLPPVEPGAVFSDWVAEHRRASSTRNREGVLCELRKTYRFGGALKEISDLAREGCTDDLIRWLQQHRDDAGQSTELPSQRQGDAQVFWMPVTMTAGNTFMPHVIAGYREFATVASAMGAVGELAQAFARFQLLCSTNEGPMGTISLAAKVEQHFFNGLGWYHGKPLLVMENQPNVGVYNGDIGFVIACHDAKREWYEVQFPQEGGRDPIVVAPGQLRCWQSAFAMTVHKSQGSEYDAVLCVLAPYAKELLTRPLLYTAITRARSQCRLAVGEEALRHIMAD